MSFTSTVVFAAPRPSYTYNDFAHELLWIPNDFDYKNLDSLKGQAALDKARNSTAGILLQAPSARFLVIYLHSNAEDIGISYDFAHSLSHLLEVHVFLVEYPGYGICPGPCSEEGMKKAVDNAYRFVREVLQWPAQDILIMGRSLGAAIALDLATRVECHGLILVAPFLSLKDVVGSFVGVLARALVGEMFDNEKHIVDVNVPTLIIHGGTDWLVPKDQVQKLFDLCPHKTKRFVCHETMGHNDDLMAKADLLIWPMLCFFQLPDYTFDEIRIPPEAFDKRLCLDYHVAPSEMQWWFRRSVPGRGPQSTKQKQRDQIEKSSNNSITTPTTTSSVKSEDDEDTSSIVWLGWPGKENYDEDHSNYDDY